MSPFPYEFPFDFDDDKWLLHVDWDGDGVFGAESEDVTSDWLSQTPLRAQRGRDQIRALNPPMVGTADVELDNISRVYSPDNSTGSLYGNIVPGRRFAIRKSLSGTMYSLFGGYLEGVPQHPERDKRSVTLSALGSFSKLRDQASGQKISTALYQTIRSDQAIGYILDAMGWPTLSRTLDTGKTTFEWWWLAEEDPFAAVAAVLATEGPGAALYEDGKGNIIFESRHYRLTTSRCTTSQATFSDSNTEPLMSLPFNYDPRLKGIVNICTFEVKTRTQAGSLTAVWSLGTTVTLGSNQSISYLATASDPFTGAVCANGTDYTVSAGSLNSMSLNRTSGGNCTLTLLAGSSGATVTGLQIRAYSVAVANTTIVASTVDTITSQKNYGVRTFPLSIRAEIAVNDAQDLVNAIAGIYQEPRAAVEFQISGVTATGKTQLLSRQISDRITVSETQTGLNGACFVEQLEYSLEYGGNLPRLKIGVEKVNASSYLIWGTGLWGTNVWGY